LSPHSKTKEFDKGATAGTKTILSAIHGSYPPKSNFTTVKAWMWIASGILLLASLVGLFSKYFSSAFFGALIPFYIVTVGLPSAGGE
jgi:hypothetical protein